jgi:surface antigen
MVGLFNIFFFHFGAKAAGDESYAFTFLSNHTPLNDKYYGKQTSISTVVINGGGLIAQAHADDYLSSQIVAQNENSNQDFTIEDGFLTQPSPDSIRALVAKQVKIYTTVPGDSLRSIAAKNGITIQTLADANNLPTDAALKPGWTLKILPIDGVIYTANSNDTLPDVAKKFSGNLDTIISYNGLDSAEDIEAGDLIIVPGGHMPLPPKPKITAKPKTTDKSKVGGDAPVQKLQDDGSDYDEVGHLFPKGYCTWYVAQKLHGLVKWGGNAKNWPANSKAYGAVFDRDPARGTILVTNESSRYGHVAYVESVNGDGTITVSEMNYEKFGKVDYRTISLSSSVIKGFIHP